MEKIDAVKHVLRNVNHGQFVNRILSFFLLFIVIIPVIALAGVVPKQLPQDGLIVVPTDATYGAARDLFITIIDGAKNKIDLSMYQLKDQGMIDALMRASKRGVQIRLVTEKNPYQHSLNQEKSILGGTDQLVKIGIPVKGLAPRFLKINSNAQAHHKILIVDDIYAVIMTCNWDVSSLTKTRDFAVIIYKDKTPEEFHELGKIFDSDWNNKQADNRNTSLIIGPNHQREDFIKLFSTAKQSIKIYQQSYNDEKIASTLEELCHKGIKVKLLMTPFPFGGNEDKNLPFQKRLIKAGGEVHLAKMYIHAKVVIIDDKIFYIGSCNFYPSSLEFNREIGIIIHNVDAVDRLSATFEKDWKDSSAKHDDTEL